MTIEVTKDDKHQVLDGASEADYDAIVAQYTKHLQDAASRPKFCGLTVRDFTSMFEPSS